MEMLFYLVVFVFMTVHFTENRFVLFAERNLTDIMLKRSDVNHRIRLDMLHSLDNHLTLFIY